MSGVPVQRGTQISREGQRNGNARFLHPPDPNLVAMVNITVLYRTGCDELMSSLVSCLLTIFSDFFFYIIDLMKSIISIFIFSFS